jgi:hypothetical protein
MNRIVRTTIRDVVAAFQANLHLPDPGIIYVVMAAVAANLMPGDPVWLLVVAPPSSGKTEVLDSLRRLVWVHMISAFTEAGLLSAAPAKKGDTTSTGGLLKQVGENGLLVAKDYTTVLEEHGSTRRRLFAVQREMYDGRYTRHVGSNGGQPVEWEGKVGLIGGVTEMIDTVDFGLMGERFVLFRLPAASPEDDYASCVVASENAGHQREIRREWSQAVVRFFADLVLPQEISILTTDSEDRLITLATLGARCRSTVVRDYYKRDTIDLVPSPERPPRLFAQLRQLHAGLLAVQTPPDDVWRLLAEVAVGGIPRDRRRVIEALVAGGSDLTTSTVGGRVGLPYTSVRRRLEDLTALGVVELVGERPERWRVSYWVRDRWWAVRGDTN